MTEDEKYIFKCFELAKNALGDVSPNPYVGSIITKNKKIISQGYHKASGMPHAEAMALELASEKLDGATLYCNLEPCCHTNKKTPPCAQRIIKSGIKRVVISNLDPNPEVAGKGVELLRNAGIEVVTSILEDKGELLNEVFFTNMRQKRAFIHLKWAQTLDGSLACDNGSSKWITNELARNYVHQERSLYDAILVGAETARKDNPKLTIRLKNKTEHSKARIILSQSKKLNSSLNILSDEFKEQTIIVSNFNELQELFDKGIKSLYIEGGAQTLSTFLEQGYYDRISAYIAPKILGSGKKIQLSKKAASIKEALILKKPHITQFHDNILFESQRNLCLQD